ncbi:MAG TPA: tetratricopeptide repeat protein [Pyrinomonadaceae bacterium]|jgi:tetratricopeptide (TPR) repeat protein|nr:tetratricopeptide repeat protein [Pyrinomonadaceae bacterium]
MLKKESQGEKTGQASASGAEGQATLRAKLGITKAEFEEMGAIGAMYYEQGILDKARAIFEGMVEIDPESADAHSALGALYTRLQSDDDALRHLSRAIALDAQQIAPHVNRAEVYLRKQMMEEAVADLKCAIELDPQEKDPGANRARAMVLGIHEALEARAVM